MDWWLGYYEDMDGNFINNLRAALGIGGSPASGSVIRDTANQLRERKGTVEESRAAILGGEDMYPQQEPVVSPAVPALRRVDLDNPYIEKHVVFNILPNEDKYSLKQDQYGNNPRLYVTYDFSGNVKSVKGIDDVASLNEEFANKISFRDGDFGADKSENNKKYDDLLRSLYDNGYHVNDSTGLNDNRYRNLDILRLYMDRNNEGNI